MSGARVALLCCLLISLLPSAGNADNAPSARDLASCAALNAPDARLTCYDALAHRSAVEAAAPAVPQQAPAAVSTAPAVTPAASTPARSAPVAATQASAAVASADDAGQFGLSAIQRHVAQVGPKLEHGQIVSLAADKMGKAIIVLDSGQTWAVTDDDGWLATGDKVVIKRASLGSFLLTSPSNHIYRVHRLQ